jgi:ABC-type sulfate transport system permease component
MLKLLNKKAQIGETITWTAATFIIIGILIIFLIFSSLLAKIKVINFNEIKSDVSDESPVFSMKTNLAHISAGNLNKETIDGILEEKNE